jgi:hypothetical protein
VRKIHYLLIAATAVVLVLAASFHQPTQAQLTALPVLLTNGTLPLPTGAATAANQATANGTLTSIATNTSNTAMIAGTIEEDTDEIASNTAGILAALQEDESLIVCDRSASVVGKSTTGATEVIPASGTSSDKVYICSYTVQAEGTTTWQFQQGTGTNCASDTAALPGAAAWSFSTTTGMLGVNRGGGIGSILDSDAGRAVCVTQGSAVQTNFEIRYTYLTPAGS